MNPRDIRLIILEQSKRAHVGHIGSSLSVAEIIAALYGRVLRISNADDPDRDRFILSKGHAALALYAALALRGIIPHKQLNTFCADNSLLGVHPEYLLPGVDFCSGSLGQGLTYGAGAALAARLQGSKRRVFVLLSDAECNEGSVWEAAMFAAHQRLGNLTAIIDLNGQQALGYTKDVCDIPNMVERWRAFGWDASEIDGHDVDALAEKMTKHDGKRPQMLVARTTFGKGVTYMHSQIKWHYLPMSEDEYRQAVAEVG
ncbi:MAG TPA: transketolase [Candidatus Cybelea sp.]|nr:transketolase [Candidatus Cybelea sp.]